MATTKKESTMNLHEKLSRIQVEFKASKSKFNSFGKYNFRSAEDILEALKPFNEKYGVYFTVSESAGEMVNIPVIHSIATINDNDGVQQIQATAIVGVDLAQKGMQIPQAFGSASSYGKKYALGNLLLIDDTQDPDATNTHGKDSVSKPTANVSHTTKATISDVSKVKEMLSKDREGTIKILSEKYELTPAQKKELGL
jgi:hypothetical protein